MNDMPVEAIIWPPTCLASKRYTQGRLPERDATDDRASDHTRGLAFMGPYYPCGFVGHTRVGVLV